MTKFCVEQAMQTCACLVYLGQEGSIPVQVPARVVKFRELLAPSLVQTVRIRGGTRRNL